MKHEEVVELLRKRTKEAGGQLALARQLGVPQPRISAILRGREPVTRQVASALGLKIEIIFVPEK